MWSKPFYMTLTWWLKSFSSTSRSLQRCKRTWFKILECSRSLRGPSTTSLKSVREVSPTNSLSRCTAVSRPQANAWSATRAMSRRCTSSDRDWSRSTIMKTMSLKRKDLFCTYQSTATSEITRSCTTWSQILFSRPSSTAQRTKSKFNYYFLTAY